MSDERLDGLTDEVLPALIARLRRSGLGELEVATDGWRIRLRREDGGRRAVGTMPTAAGSSGHGSTETSSDPAVNLARSPGVGYFSPTPELVIGRSVRAGDVLGQVDVLGIGHEVSAPSDGLISRVLAEDGQAVEYGQALAEIDILVAGAADAPAPDAGG